MLVAVMDLESVGCYYGCRYMFWYRFWTFGIKFCRFCLVHVLVLGFASFAGFALDYG